MKDLSQQERVLISFTVSRGAEEAIETGVTLAAILGIEVAGFFVQLQTVAGLSEFPFATAYLPGGHQAQQITKSSMEQAFQRQSAHCRRLLSERAARLSLKWSYRDIPPAQAVDEPGHGGIQVLPMDWMFPNFDELLQSIKDVVAEGSAVAVSAGRYAGQGAGPIVAIIDPSKNCTAVLRQAERLVSRGDRPLYILLLSNDADAARKIEADAVSLLGPTANLRILRSASKTPGDVVHMVNQADPAFVIADFAYDIFATESDAASIFRLVNSAIIFVPQE